jgi:hypothetical protein
MEGAGSSWFGSPVRPADGPRRRSRIPLGREQGNNLLRIARLLEMVLEAG